MPKITSVFKTLEYPFLIDIVVDNKKIISLNSDNFKVRLYQKDSNKMAKLLEIVGKSIAEGRGTE